MGVVHVSRCLKKSWLGLYMKSFRLLVINTLRNRRVIVDFYNSTYVNHYDKSISQPVNLVTLFAYACCQLASLQSNPYYDYAVIWSYVFSKTNVTIDLLKVSFSYCLCKSKKLN